MKGRPLKLPFLFFLIITFIILFSILEAYSTLITISEVEPLPRRGSIQYFYSKVGDPSMFAEIRKIELKSNNQNGLINSVEVTWYRKLIGNKYYWITVSATINLEAGDNVVVSDTKCYSGDKIETTPMTLNQIINIDDIVGVSASATINGECSLSSSQVSTGTTKFIGDEL